MNEILKHGKRLSKDLYYYFDGYLKILVVVSLLIVSISLTFTDSLVIYAQKDKPDYMQVFFPIYGVYSEENSERSTLVENPGNDVKITITLPRTSIDYVRIDPANEATEVVITKVELRYLFGTETFMPSELVDHAKPIQMIDKLEVTPAGLLIRTTGNDPVFELQLNRPSAFSRYMMLCIISVFVSLAVFLAVKKLAYLKMPVVNKKIYLLAIPFLASLGIAALFYPGFMSYDTLHALRGARNGVTDSMWPPMVSYVWRVVDLLSPNPAAMHFSQVSLLIFSIFFVVFFYTKKISYATVFLLIYLSIPVVLGTVAVIWKDVLMAAFFLSGFAVILSMRLVVNKWWFIFLSLLAICLIFLGVCSRHNAITGAVPLLFYLTLVVCSQMIKTRSRLLLCVILLGSMLTSVVFLRKLN